jgi:hypothetical protein
MLGAEVSAQPESSVPNKALNSLSAQSPGIDDIQVLGKEQFLGLDLERHIDIKNVLGHPKASYNGL